MLAIVIRAKTFTTLGQLNGKRKSHLIRFLYEVSMINVGQTLLNLEDVDLSGMHFRDYTLTNVSFAKCNLFRVTFHRTSLESIDFTRVQLGETSFKFTNSTFINGSFVRTKFSGASMNDAIFYKANLTGAYSILTNFSYPNLLGNIFDQSDVITHTSICHVKLIDTVVDNSDLS
jgi:uncharacterized protein YjbI with pentapeptide repeats